MIITLDIINRVCYIISSLHEYKLRFILTSLSRGFDMLVSGSVLHCDFSSVSSENKVVLFVLASLGSDATKSKSWLKMFFSVKPSCRHKHK